jgi:N-acetylmuramic acid 6-phosphate etherase
MIVIGLMSGTSADGIDAVVVELHGAPPLLHWRILAQAYQPHPPDLRDTILAACDPRRARVDTLAALHVRLGEAFAEAAISAARVADIPLTQIDLIGSHGQTIWHAPQGDPPVSWQLGDPATIAERCGIAVVSDFRARDVAAGGQGAPLVAAVDQLLLSHPQYCRAAQNIGGIANLTYLPAGGVDAFAFDTGPGNMLIDATIRQLSGGAQQFDVAGAWAAQGQVHRELLHDLLAHPYFEQIPPKTTGRELFGIAFAEQFWAHAATYGLSAADQLATATALTAESIAQAYQRFLPDLPDQIIVSGGGARNHTLIAMLQQALPGCIILRSEQLGIADDAKEALAFAVLAYETWHQRPSNLPAATGARRAVVLGSITPRAASVVPAATPTATPTTEQRHPASMQIDQLSTQAMLAVINQADAHVAEAVQVVLPEIAAAVDAISARLQQGGRLIYIGAGTSGRLGVLDASECPPTFSTPPGLVLGIIAGGPQALTNSIEGAEDSAELGQQDLAAVQLSAQDCVVGIAASGSTPYVLGALRYANQCGALTVSVACNHPSAIAAAAQIAIAAVVGPEIITGSTRMKAGTAQKLILNMLSTGVMIRLGKTYGNLMVDLQASNSKLQRRTKRIVAEATGLAPEQAAQLLANCAGEVKTAIVAALADCPPEEARQRLAQANGVVRAALFA